jgi:iron complex outermembrane receptor protein
VACTGQFRRRNHRLLGADVHLGEHDSTGTDPVNTPALRIENFNGVRRDVYGFFAEWNGAIATGLNIELGARYNRVDTNADRVASTMMVVNALQNRFNNADRSKTDNNIDLRVKRVHPLSPRLSLTIEGGHKTRSPSYRERYLWLPLEATNGLADGNTYAGDIDLNPELAYEFGTGFNWRDSRFHFEPRVFYRYVNDYIQGVPASDPLVTAFNPSALQFGYGRGFYAALELAYD